MALLAHQKSIGDGWGGAEQYATPKLMLDAHAASDYGQPVEGILKGFFGNDNILNHAPINGALIYGDVQFDGTNQANLAYGARLSITGTNIHVSHVKLTNNYSFGASAEENGTNCSISYFYVEDEAAYALDAYGTGGGNYHHGVVKSNGIKAVKTGWNRPLNLSNMLFFGTTATAVTASGGNQQIKDCLFITDGTCLSGTFAVSTNNATKDNTGQLTGYTSVELVNFAAGDYRIKSSSALFSAGVGAFFEAVAATASVQASVTFEAQLLGNTTQNAVINAQTLMNKNSSKSVQTQLLSTQLQSLLLHEQLLTTNTKTAQVNTQLYASITQLTELQTALGNDLTSVIKSLKLDTALYQATQRATAINTKMLVATHTMHELTAQLLMQQQAGVTISSQLVTSAATNYELASQLLTNVHTSNVLITQLFNSTKASCNLVTQLFTFIQQSNQFVTALAPNDVLTIHINNITLGEQQFSYSLGTNTNPFSLG